MESFWTKKAEANQNHIQAYLIEARFDGIVEERGLREYFYNLRVEIDGNVTEWKFETDAEEVALALRAAFDLENLTSEEVKVATAKVAEKNQWQYEILDEAKLIKDLKKIGMSAEQPEVTDDAIMGETVRFLKF